MGEGDCSPPPSTHQQNSVLLALLGLLARLPLHAGTQLTVGFTLVRRLAATTDAVAPVVGFVVGRDADPHPLEGIVQPRAEEPVEVAHGLDELRGGVVAHLGDVQVRVGLQEVTEPVVLGDPLQVAAHSLEVVGRLGHEVLEPVELTLHGIEQVDDTGSVDLGHPLVDHEASRRVGVDEAVERVRRHLLDALLQVGVGLLVLLHVGVGDVAGTFDEGGLVLALLDTVAGVTEGLSDLALHHAEDRRAEDRVDPRLELAEVSRRHEALGDVDRTLDEVLRVTGSLGAVLGDVEQGLASLPGDVAERRVLDDGGHLLGELGGDHRVDEHVGVGDGHVGDNSLVFRYMSASCWPSRVVPT